MVGAIFPETFSGLRLASLLASPPQFFCEHKGFSGADSCDPTTLARDLKSLADSYFIDKIEGFDLFPQTYHVETLCLLTKKTL